MDKYALADLAADMLETTQMIDEVNRCSTQLSDVFNEENEDITKLVNQWSDLIPDSVSMAIPMGAALQLMLNSIGMMVEENSKDPSEREVTAEVICRALDNVMYTTVMKEYRMKPKK